MRVGGVITTPPLLLVGVTQTRIDRMMMVERRVTPNDA
jgi:hypothetical protein